MKKYHIGFGVTTKRAAIGSAFVVMIVADTQFFRQYLYLVNKRAADLSNEERRRIVQQAAPLVAYAHYVTFKPNVITSKEVLDDLLASGIMTCLNSYKEFWNCGISVPLLDKTREEFITRLQRFVPPGLKDTDLNIDRWVIGKNNISKACRLAEIWERYLTDKEIASISRLYGNYGENKLGDVMTSRFIKKNPACPHIRKYILEGGK